MYNKSRLALKYIQYYFIAVNGKGHGTHSPFVFDFITHVLNDHKQYYAYYEIERLREKLQKDNTLLEITDMGARSVAGSSNKRSIRDIARNSLKPKKYAQLLFRMVNYYQPSVILELGTSLGITTAYLASAGKTNQVFTLEGASSVARLAKQYFDNLQLNNIELISGNFDDTLLPLLGKLKYIDFAFVDGNHRYEPTLRYFQWLQSYLTETSIIVFDDIHWSEEMETAWNEIKMHPSVTCSIDLFFIGIVFFNRGFKEKQDFTIRF